MHVAAYVVVVLVLVVLVVVLLLVLVLVRVFGVILVDDAVAVVVLVVGVVVVVVVAVLERHVIILELQVPVLERAEYNLSQYIHQSQQLQFINLSCLRSISRCLVFEDYGGSIVTAVHATRYGNQYTLRTWAQFLLTIHEQNGSNVIGAIIGSSTHFLSTG